LVPSRRSASSVYGVPRVSSFEQLIVGSSCGVQIPSVPSAHHYHPPPRCQLSKATEGLFWGYIEAFLRYTYMQARREPQRGPGKHYRGALSPHSVCLEIETPKASRGRKRGERCPLTNHHPTRGSGERRKLRSGVRGGAPAEMDFMYILGQKEPFGTPFTVFLSNGGPPKRRGARENFPPFPPLDGPAYM